MLKKIIASIFVFSMIFGSQIQVSAAHHYDSDRGHYCDQYGCH